MRRIRAAVVGCGNVATFSHIPSLVALKDRVSVVAVSDIDQGKAESASKRFGINDCCRSWEEMIDREDPDVVHVCTPPDSHAQISVAALERGCHVMVEKPMALTIRECDEMIGAATRSGRMLCVAHNQRFHPCFLKARRMIACGGLGEVIDVRITHQIRKARYLDPAHWVHGTNGGLPLEIFPHPTYLALSLLGSVDLLSAEALKFDDATEVPYDTFRVALSGGKARCTIFVSHGGENWNYNVEIVGKEGEIVIDLYNSLILTKRLPSLKVVDKNLSSIRQWIQLTSQSASSALRPGSKRWLQTHQALIREFVESIAGGGRPPSRPRRGGRPSGYAWKSQRE